MIERDDALVIVVADGAGGIRGGAEASEALIEAARSACAAPSFSATDVPEWQRLFDRVDASLAARMAGETTAVVVIVSTGGVFGVSAGDSEAWVIGEPSTSIDDLTAAQSKKRLGSGRARPNAFYRLSLDGTLVVATDGLFKYAARAEIADAVHGRPARDASDRAVALVRLASGAYPDDLAVVCVRLARVTT